MTACTHPSDRQYAIVYYNPTEDGDYLWVGCTLCGKHLCGATDRQGNAAGPQRRLSPKKKKRKSKKEATP